MGFDISPAGKAFSTVELEEYKSRIDLILKTTSNNLVIFVDDIDRLDKQEIYSLFRLVKLTADFSNTTYLLSFDEVMVASAIGERFGSGDKKAGENFLEKIIQVPISIPKAHPQALKRFCFKFIYKALESNNIVLTEDEIQRFTYQFTTNILPKLSTPRLAVRYGNALSFSLPLLYREVNMVDLMLIESLKVFYPTHYSFIKQNEKYFIGNEFNDLNPTYNQQKKADFKLQLDKESALLNSNEKRFIEELMANLFPKLRTIYDDYQYSSEVPEKWYADKRIASPEYFDRYFSYVVIEEDISDIEFDIFKKNILHKEIEDIVKEMKNIIQKSNIDTFLRLCCMNQAARQQRARIE